MMNKNLVTRGKTIFSRISKKIIISIVTICIAIGILIGINYSYSSTVKQADEAMSQKDYDKAVDMYGQALSIHNKAEIQSKLSKAEELRTSIQKSKKAFDEGMKYFENKDYNKAYLTFKDVIEEDTTNYDNALKKGEESKNIYIATQIESANNLASIKDYSDAVKSLDKALSVDPTNKEAIDLRAKYKEVNDINLAKFTKENNEERARKAEEAKQKKKSEGVRIGMTKDEVLGSNWGQPKSVNKTTGKYGTHEQWVYGGNNYLYFENGILTSFQN